MSLQPYSFPLSVYDYDDPLRSQILPFSSVNNRQLANLSGETMKPLAPLMSADLIESDNDYHLHVDMPGVENLNITSENRVLTVTAERKVKHENDNNLTHSIERSYGKVKRTFNLPLNADTDLASAKYIDGVLTISLPKKEGVSAKKKISIS